MAPLAQVGDQALRRLGVGLQPRGQLARRGVARVAGPVEAAEERLQRVLVGHLRHPGVDDLVALDLEVEGVAKVGVRRGHGAHHHEALVVAGQAKALDEVGRDLALDADLDPLEAGGRGHPCRALAVEAGGRLRAEHHDRQAQRRGALPVVRGLAALDVQRRAARPGGHRVARLERAEPVRLRRAPTPRATGGRQHELVGQQRRLHELAPTSVPVPREAEADEAARGVDVDEEGVGERPPGALLRQGQRLAVGHVAERGAQPPARGRELLDDLPAQRPAQVVLLLAAHVADRGLEPERRGLAGLEAAARGGRGRGRGDPARCAPLGLRRPAERDHEDRRGGERHRERQPGASAARPGAHCSASEPSIDTLIRRVLKVGEEKLKRLTFRLFENRRKPTLPTIETSPASGWNDMSQVASPRASSTLSAVRPQPSVVSSGKRVVTKLRSATTPP
jgi:hypothetical protein